MAIPLKYMRISVDAPVPNGWELVDTMPNRKGKLIRERPAPGKAPVTEAEVDDLISAFGRAGIEAKKVPADELSALMNGMSLGSKSRTEGWGGEEGGRRRKKTRGVFKGKTRKGTRKASRKTRKH